MVRVQDLQGAVTRQRLQVMGRESGVGEQVVGIDAHCGQPSKGQARRPAGHEGKNVSACPVQPLKIVDEQEHRPVGGRRLQQRDDGCRERETPRRRSSVQPHGRVQRRPLCTGQPGGVTLDAQHQLMQGGVGELCLELDALHHENPETLCTSGSRRCPKDGCLADARVAREDERRRIRIGALEQAFDQTHFGFAPYEGRGGSEPRVGHAATA